MISWRVAPLECGSRSRPCASEEVGIAIVDALGQSDLDCLSEKLAATCRCLRRAPALVWRLPNTTGGLGVFLMLRWQLNCLKLKAMPRCLPAVVRKPPTSRLLSGCVRAPVFASILRLAAGQSVIEEALAWAAGALALGTDPHLRDERAAGGEVRTSASSAPSGPVPWSRKPSPRSAGGL